VHKVTPKRKVKPKVAPQAQVNAKGKVNRPTRRSHESANQERRQIAATEPASKLGRGHRWRKLSACRVGTRADAGPPTRNTAVTRKRLEPSKRRQESNEKAPPKQNLKSLIPMELTATPSAHQRAENLPSMKFLQFSAK